MDGKRGFREVPTTVGQPTSWIVAAYPVYEAILEVIERQGGGPADLPNLMPRYQAAPPLRTEERCT